MATRTKRTKHPTYTIKHVGNVYVDTGQCWIGDPCFLLPDGEEPAEITRSFANWHEFCEKAISPSSLEGKGVIVPTGMGDGIYPVYATFNEAGRVTTVSVSFLEEEDGGEYAFEGEEEQPIDQL